VICTECGTTNDNDRKFCMECGSGLASACSACGSANPPRSKFCGECGASLSAARSPITPPAEAPVHSTERRLVSVLFVDLVSFTTLSERRDAEDMRSVMDAYFATARTVIERHGGTVEKFIGDAVMALWGAPVTLEDDAERAVRAALELLDAVEGLGAALDLPLQARAGVLTGEAATAPDAGNQAMVTGDMVNTAARLQSAAPPGATLVGQATVRAASGAIAFDAAGQVDLKGKAEPVSTWRALRVIGERQGRQGRGQNRIAIEPPFVGRAEELRLMKDLLHATGREGRARLVSVMGVGGIGKSRLAWELLKYVDGLSEDIYWHHGRCPSYGDGVTFWALGEMVRMRAGIAETDSAADSRAKLDVSVAEFVSDEEERRWLHPRLAFLLGLDDRPAGGREELFAAWRTFFERVSERGTVAMIFEDLHRADSGLLDFIESMLEWSRGKPIYIVALTRPDLLERRTTWGVGQRSLVSLHLEPLSDVVMTALVQAMVPAADDDAVGRIVVRAEGMPLYAVEMIRMLVDMGVLVASGAAYEVAGDLGHIQVPETLHALIASRLDALGPRDRALVQDAAVLGKSFTIEALAAVADEPRGELEQRLPDLVRKEFVELEVDPRSPERGQYSFVQSIIREVAYGMLAKADRRSRHLAAAHHFEAAGDDELAAVVATHYLEALEATPPGPDAEALAARARDGLGRAAERATALGAPAQALGYLEQALDFTPVGHERVALLQQAADAATDALRRDERLQYLREAIGILHELGDRNAELVAMGALGSALGSAVQVEELRSLVPRMRRMLGADANPLARAGLDHATGWLQYYDGEMSDCLVSLDRAVGGYERAGQWRQFSLALSAKVTLLAMTGRHREARLLLRGELAVATDANDLREMANALGSLALHCEEATASVDYSMQAAAAARRGGYGEMEIAALTNGLEAAIETGGWASAADIIETLRERDDLPEPELDTALLGAALLAAYRGDDATARASLSEVSRASREGAKHDLRAWARRVSAVVALMNGELELAFEQALDAITTDPSGINAPLAGRTAGQAAVWMRDPERARRILTESGEFEGTWNQSIQRTIEAGIAALEGRQAEAAAAYDTVLAGRRSAGDLFAHALVAVEAASVLPAHLVPDGAVDSARAHLEGIGAAPLLARLDAALAVTTSASS